MIVLFAMSGAALGALHLALLRRAVEARVAGGSDGAPALRFALTLLGFATLARVGAGAAVAGMAGFLAARTAILRGPP